MSTTNIAHMLSPFWSHDGIVRYKDETVVTVDRSPEEE